METSQELGSWSDEGVGGVPVGSSSSSSCSECKERNELRMITHLVRQYRFLPRIEEKMSRNTHPKILEGLGFCKLRGREAALPSNFSTLVFGSMRSRLEVVEVAEGLGEGGSAKESA